MHYVFLFLLIVRKEPCSLWIMYYVNPPCLLVGLSFCLLVVVILKGSIPGYKGGTGNESRVGWLQETCDELGSPRLLGLFEV